jgi:hypothetical protein
MPMAPVWVDWVNNRSDSVLVGPTAINGEENGVFKATCRWLEPPLPLLPEKT